MVKKTVVEMYQGILNDLMSRQHKYDINELKRGPKVGKVQRRIKRKIIEVEKSILYWRTQPTEYKYFVNPVKRSEI